MLLLWREADMNWTEINSDLEDHSAALQDRWGRLTDEDVAAAKAGRNELIGCVLKRYKIEKDLAERHVDDWIRSRA